MVEIKKDKKDEGVKVIHEIGIGIFGADTTYDVEDKNNNKDDKKDK